MMQNKNHTAENSAELTAGMESNQYPWAENPGIADVRWARNPKAEGS
jgi:hypothetical protein